MRKLRLRLIRLLAGRDFIDPEAHPVLSKHPEILGCSGQSWRRFSDVAPGQTVVKPLLDRLHLVSTGYSEEIANDMGVSVMVVKALRSEIVEGIAKAVENAARGYGRFRD